LADNSELIYHHSEFYKSGNEGGIKYNDPMIGIEWLLPAGNISERDNNHPALNEQFKGI
jgi:dTDP-4-dehydrorhamnose 3,5-epimerase